MITETYKGPPCRSCQSRVRSINTRRCIDCDRARANARRAANPERTKASAKKYWAGTRAALAEIRANRPKGN